jgi:coniferyl-aldehyde dehydrogenase
MNPPMTAPTELTATLGRLRAAQRAHILDYRERIALLERLGEAVRGCKDELIAAAAADFGRRAPFETLAGDVMVVLDEIKHARKHLRSWMKPRRAPVNLAALPARGQLRYVPLGVVGIMVPWNYPFMLAFAPLVNVIAAGNRAMIKPSEFSPRTSALVERVVKEVFTPEQVAVAQGDAAVGAAFAALPFDHLIFTGSTAVGRKVMAAAAANLTPVTLELGGKSPALVAPGYSIEHAAERIAFGKCFNAGQSCVAPDYVLVPRAQRDAFADAYLANMRQRYPTLADNPDYTAIVDDRQAARLRDWLEDARRRGTQVRQYAPTGETIPPGLELIPPTVLLDPPDDAIVMQQEIFGPLLSLKSYDSYEDALGYVLDRDKPLAFYTFDDDRTRVEATLERICAGMVCVNDSLIQFGQTGFPVGGVGASGMGHYHGHAGFLTFSKAMPVMYQSRWNGMKLLDPPYTGWGKRMIEWLTR